MERAQQLREAEGQSRYTTDGTKAGQFISSWIYTQYKYGLNKCIEKHAFIYDLEDRRYMKWVLPPRPRPAALPSRCWECGWWCWKRLTSPSPGGRLYDSWCRWSAAYDPEREAAFIQFIGDLTTSLDSLFDSEWSTMAKKNTGSFTNLLKTKRPLDRIWLCHLWPVKSSREWVDKLKEVSLILLETLLISRGR